MNQNFFKKNVSLRIAICLLLFIPLVAAIIYGLNVNPNTVSAGSLEKITITTPDGSNFRVDDEDSLKFYTSLTSGAKEISKDFRDFSKETPYIITYSESNSNTIEYKLYTHELATDYVCVLPDGKYFLLSEETAKAVSGRNEFSKQTDISELLPVVSVTSFGITTELSADGYDWTYFEEDGTKTSLAVPSEGKINPTVKFDMTDEGILKFNFDKQPDDVTVTIKSGNTELFGDKLEKLPSSNKLSFHNDEKLTASVVAEWYEIEGAEFFGKATYNFDLLFDVAPTYKVVDTKALPTGDFTVLRMTDFNDGEQLTVINEIGIPEKVNVYNVKDSNVKITFIPLGSTLGTGTHKLTLKTDLGQTFDISVSSNEKDEYDTQTLLINEETDGNLSKAFTKEALAEIDSLVSKYTLESANEMLYNGAFVYPTGSSKVVAGGASYGTTRSVYSINSSGESYISMGHDLECMTNQNIVAANNGNVVYAGETALLGNTVIIDHGYGILSLYGNLSSINVKVGDAVVKKDSVIGIAGSTGFACADTGVSATTKTMCHYAVSMNGVFVAPKAVFNGIFIGN